MTSRIPRSPQAEVTERISFPDLEGDTKAEWIEFSRLFIYLVLGCVGVLFVEMADDGAV